MKNLGAEYENLDYKAYHVLKDMIINRELLPGEKIPQEKVAADLGISRTPLVNALKFLEHEKLIKALPRRGYFVRLFTQQEMISIFELREVLEGLAARRACEQISEAGIHKLKGFFKRFEGVSKIEDFKDYAKEDRKFHNFVTDTGAKEFLRSILVTYNVIVFSYQLDAEEGLVRPPSETIKEHSAIIRAITHRDPEQAEMLMRLHLRRSLEVLKQGSDAHQIDGSP
ncbi:MAG: GntR family transcriptional regulator [Desulfatiglandaceae bacterium]